MGSSPVALDAEGSRIGVVSLNGLALLSIDELGAYVKSVRRDGLGTRRTDHVRLYAAADVILLNRGKDGVEALNLANAESIWWRKDVVADYYRNVPRS